MNNQQTISLKKIGLHVMLYKDTHHTAGLISCAGVTGRWGLLSHAQNVVMHTCTHPRVHARTHVRAHAHTRMHAHMHTHMQTNTHIYRHTPIYLHD